MVGVNNIGIGNDINTSNMKGSHNIGIGQTVFNNLPSGSDGHNNIAIGENVMTTLTYGNDNIAIGEDLLPVITDGTNNIVFGQSSLSTLTIGNDNTAIGLNVLSNLITGSHNIAIGQLALNSALSDSNVAIGYNAGNQITTGNNNVMIGDSVGTAATVAGLDNVILIGANVSGIDAVSNFAHIGAGLTGCYIDAEYTTIAGNLITNNGDGLIAIGQVQNPASSTDTNILIGNDINAINMNSGNNIGIGQSVFSNVQSCLLYTSPSPRDRTRSRMPSSA